MKKLTKKLTALAIAFAGIMNSAKVFAAVDPGRYNGTGATINTGKIDTFGQNIISVVTTIGSIASVIVLVILGIKYMMGSAEEKAEYKKTLLPYVLGAVLVFAASSIASIVFSFANGTWG